MNAATQPTVLLPRRSGPWARTVELWRYRHFISFFGRRYVQKRYHGTWLGWLWLPLRPAIDVGSRALLFGGFLGVASGDRPYFIFFVVGMSAWVLFERTTYWGTRAIQMNRAVLERLFVPRLTTVVGAVIPSVVDFLLYALIALLGIVYYWVTQGSIYVNITPTFPIAALGVVLLGLFGIAVTLWLAPPAGEARDIRFGLRYFTGFWFFLTPVVYPISAIPPKYARLAELNPLTAPVEMVKYGVLETAPPTTTSLISCAGSLVVLLVGGLWIFSRSERAAVARL